MALNFKSRFDSKKLITKFNNVYKLMCDVSRNRRLLTVYTKHLIMLSRHRGTRTRMVHASHAIHTGLVFMLVAASSDVFITTTCNV